jgi:HAMP domain-containing protein
MPIVVQVCIIVATLALAAVAFVLIRAIAQLGSTMAQLERTMARLETTIPEVERTVVEVRGVLDSVGQVAMRIDRLTAEFADTGSRFAKASSLVVNEVIEPAAQIAALVKGVRAGASSLVGTFLNRKRGVLAASANEGGNHDE